MVENVVYLVRHGESVANTQGIYQGQTYDTPLSELGQKQADALGKRLRGVAIDRLVTSPLTRTRQTAEAIATWQGDLQVEIEPEIIETNHGQWEGKPVLMIKDQWPREYRIWQTEPSRAEFPGGETYAETRERTMRWWNEFLPIAHGTTVVVTHDNIIRAILVDTLAMQPDALWNMELQPAAITKVTRVDNNVKVTAVNDTNHLEGLRANLANHAL